MKSMVPSDQLLVHFHQKVKESLGKQSGGITVLIPVRLGAGYPRCVKGESTVEIPLTIGSALLWNAMALMVFPAVEKSGGFAIILNYQEG